MAEVKISGTFKKEDQINNGLNEFIQELLKDEFAQHVVVAVVEVNYSRKDRGAELVPVVKLVAVEPLSGDASDQGRQLIDQARKVRGLGKVESTLFDID